MSIISLIAIKTQKRDEKDEFERNIEEPYIIAKDRIISFFYVDDIAFVFKKDKANEVKKIVDSQSKPLIIKVIGELKRFLEFHVICNHTKASIWLSQKADIMYVRENLAHTNLL